MLWVEYRIQIPEEDGRALDLFLRERLNLMQIDEDWCTMKREEDFARVDFGPLDPPTHDPKDW